MKTRTWKLQIFSTNSLIILILALKLQQQYVEAEYRECDDNKFGHECRYQCRCNQNAPCDVKTGACRSGCAPDYWGPNCQLSSDCYYNGNQTRYNGTKSVTVYGETCTKWNHGQHNYCRAVNNNKVWCHRYSTSRYCSLNNCSCPPGLYGIDCTEQCHCKNASEVCGTYTGHCLSRCSPGWTGKYCNKVCTFGTFGKECSGTCHCEDNTKCQNTNGTCLDGACSPGYMGPQCQTTCHAGKFGSGCKRTCHCKVPQNCNPVNGRCSDGKCKFGYQGPSCQKRSAVFFIVIGLIPLVILISVVAVVTACVIFIKNQSFTKDTTATDPLYCNTG